MPLDETTATIQYRAATDIAAERFGFPNDEFPNLQTHVNLPVLKMPVQGPGGEILGPDIVVVDDNGILQLVGAVETVHTVNAMSARQRWAKFARLGVPFYLYIPAGFVNETKKLLKAEGIKDVKLRTWRYIAGLNWTLDLTDITREFSPLELMPPLLHEIMLKRKAKAEAGKARKREERALRDAEEAAREAEWKQQREEARAAIEAARAEEPQYPHTTAPRQ
ncbi:MAG: hypothetical protein WEB00_14440 [Dehalococcoidia bacterium]